MGTFNDISGQIYDVPVIGRALANGIGCMLPVSNRFPPPSPLPSLSFFYYLFFSFVDVEERKKTRKLKYSLSAVFFLLLPPLPPTPPPFLFEFFYFLLFFDNQYLGAMRIVDVAIDLMIKFLQEIMDAQLSFPRFTFPRMSEMAVSATRIPLRFTLFFSFIFYFI